VFALLCASLPQIYGLYEDEAGVIDWSKEHVGVLKDVKFFNTNSRKQLFVSTQANTLAALSFKNHGEIAWRRVFGEHDNIDKIVTKGNSLFSVSSGGKYNRLWDNSDGSLLYELVVDTEPASVLDALFVSDTDGDGSEEIIVALVHSSSTTLHAISNGKTLWKKTFNYKFTNVAEQGNLIAATATDGTTLRALTISIADGSQKSDKALEAALCSAISDNTVYFVKKTDNSFELASSKFGSDSSKVETSLEALSLGNIQQCHLAVLGEVVAFQTQRTRFLVKKSDGSVLTSGRQSVLTNAVKSPEASMIASVSMQNDAIQVALVGSDGKKTEHSIRYTYRAQVAKAFLDVVQRKDSGLTYRLVVQYDDGHITFIADNNISWTRDEDLSFIHTLRIMDFPSSQAMEDIYSILSDVNDQTFGRFLARLKAQQQDLVDTIKSLLGQDVGATTVSPSDLSDLEIHGARHGKVKPVTKDQFGFRQLILALTDYGTVYGINTESGNILWKKDIPSCTVRSIHHDTVQTGAHLDLIIQRKSAHYPPLAAVVCSLPTQKESHIYWFNPLTGVTVHADQTSPDQHYEKLDYIVESSIVLPQQDSKGNHILLLVDSLKNVHVFPKTQQTAHVFSNTSSPVHFYEVRKNHIQGYAVNAKSQAEKGVISSSSVKTWEMPFLENEQVVSVAYPNHDEPISSATRILGNRNALGKYLNKNMVAVATVQTTDSESYLHVYLVDSVTGDLVHHAFVKGANGPVHMVQSENWVIFHYWNTKLFRWDITVLELFEKKLDWSGTTTFSSYNASNMLPSVLQQSYIFPTAVKSLAVTVTTKGIASKQILFGTSSDQIVALPKSLFDPRRPPKAQFTAEDKEEGLLPYDPKIVPSLKNTVSYYKQIKNLRGIVTSPAYLESTCLIVAHGLDLFFTRVAPSNTFDILNPDFNYVALILTSITLFGATIVSSQLVKRRELSRLWK